MFQVTYAIYGDSCSAQLLCDTKLGLSCPSTASGCDCPNTLAADKCDCPTTHYWDGSACVTRVTHSGSCTVGQNYMCNFNFYYSFELKDYKSKLIRIHV